ncbi:MAG TPA: alpha-2-macroglobulin family protein, partial [Myxococcota bacterium]|nr:alpha-2-macroglobulin family protein [Myxococcota bacterium]
ADGEDGQAPALRSWFPESFLWMPLVQTGPEGTVTVPVQVPDSLTTWRVLALGLTASGAQGGATTTFLSPLPAYVDMNLPSFLYAGDRLSLPVQVVSQQAEPLKGMLSLSV